MARVTDIPSSVVAGISFVGRGGGAVKTLGGFKKGHHTVPDAANATTNAFLGKLCAGELGDEAEKLFQEVRAAFGYRRKDVALEVTSPTAVLTAKDFVLELTYALEERDPAQYAVLTTLRDVKNADVAKGEAMGSVFAGKFSELSFALKKGARVEAVIDAIEGLADSADAAERPVLRVNYPSDCSECTIAVEGVEAQVRFTGASLEIVFPRAGAPGELIDGFAAVRGAFAISKVLRGLIG